MVNRILLSLCILWVINTVSNSQNILGKYRSNFADLGFFMTEIEFKPDFSFHYMFAGDLQHIELDGDYKIVNRLIYLRFDRLKEDFSDSLVKIVGNDTIVDFSQFHNMHSYDLKTEEGIEYHLKYLSKGDRLFFYHIITNKIVKRNRYYSDKKRFLLFGPTYHYKKWYLRKLSS